MGSVMIINASPRAPKSNSRIYSGLFSSFCSSETGYYELKKSNHSELCEKMESHTDVLLVFPLYADSLPVTLLNFLKTLESELPKRKPTVSVMINCGFIESYQNDIAVEMLQFYCRTYGFPFGSVLKIGSGEAILDTPFRLFVNRKIRKLAGSIVSGKHQTFSVTMPIPKTLFLRASSAYWKNYGKRNGITKQQMETMKIE